MPISSTIILALLSLCALMPLAHQAYAEAGSRQLILHATQLERDKRIMSKRNAYKALASATVVYERCGAELGIADEQQIYLRQKFIDVAREYQGMFQTVFTERAGIPPGQIFMNDVTNLLKQKQQDALDKTETVISREGCRDRVLKPILVYVDSVRMQDDAPAEQIIVPAKPEDAAPVATVPPPY